MRVNVFSLLGGIGLVAAALAVLTAWLVVRQPVVVADAVASGQLEPLLSTVARELADLLTALVRLL